MKKQVNINFSIDEAKIIFDALSSHRYKILNKKETISDEMSGSANEREEKQEEFVSLRIMAIESEIEKTDQIFKKLGDYVKEAG